MDANSGEPWSEADISDLKNEIDHGRTIAETASFLCRDVYEVRAKMKELITEQAARRPLNTCPHRVISRITTAASAAPEKATPPRCSMRVTAVLHDPGLLA
jgi:hypothetical protein